MLILPGVALLFWGYINLAGSFGRSLQYKLDPDAKPKQTPAVALLTAGRNEAEHLPTVLPELCEQDYPNLEVVLIDDDSDDDSPAIANQMADQFDRLSVVRLDGPPPAGWVGKCWALHQGYATLDDQAQWLCFTDADIHWDARLLSAAMAYAEAHDAELLGLVPRLRFGSKAEAVVQLQLVLALGLALPFEKAMDPATPQTLTGGAFILVKRSWYDAVGGHEAVKGEIVDDLKLGMAIKAEGAKHAAGIAGDLLWCRMYDGWADMWEGLTKNVYAGLGSRWWLALLMSLAVLICNVLPPVYAVWHAVDYAASRDPWSLIGLGLSIMAVGFGARALNATRKLMDLPAWYAWTLPVGSAVYLCILATSVYRHHTGGAIWKGRRYGAASASQ
jgi:hypothetical protein